MPKVDVTVRKRGDVFTITVDPWEVHVDVGGQVSFVPHGLVKKLKLVFNKGGAWKRNYLRQTSRLEGHHLAIKRNDRRLGRPPMLRSYTLHIEFTNPRGKTVRNARIDPDMVMDT